MSDPLGTVRSEDLGVVLADVGQEVMFDDDLVRVWAITLAPGETQEFHLHRHPYVVVSLVGDQNQIETIFGETRSTSEPPGNVVVRREASPVHRLTNVSDVQYQCRLIEMKCEDWNLG